MTFEGKVWLERFFGGRNALKWSDLASGNATEQWAEDVVPWVRLAKSDNSDLPVVLPCVGDNGEVAWYAGARSSRTAEKLREQLMGFIGPSYSDWAGEAYILNPSDSIEAAFGEEHAAPVFVISPSNTNAVPRIRRVLRLLVGLVERSPRRRFEGRHSFGILRGMFDRAILASDEVEARRLFEQLVATGRLSAENRLYLEVRLLAGLGRWPQIVGDCTLLRRLADLALPPAVLRDVIEAIYQIHVLPFELSGSIAAGLDGFRKAGLHRFARLFATRRGVAAASLIKTFAFFEASKHSPDAAHLWLLLSLLEQEGDTSFVAKLKVLVPLRDRPSTPERDVGEEADFAFEEDEFERALTLYIESPPTPKRLRRMIYCAQLVGDRNLAQKVLASIERDHSDDLGGLNSRANESLDFVRALVNGGLTTTETGSKEDPRQGWREWARWVSAGASVDEALSVLQESSLNWETSSIAADPSAVKELASLIGNAEGHAASIFREAYCALFEAFVPEFEPPVRAFKPILAILLTNAVLLDGPSLDELELVRQTVEALVQIGLNEGEYEEVVSDLGDLLGYHASLATLSWALDVAEVLSLHATPKPETRLAFVMSVVGLAKRLSHRLSPAHRISLKLLCKDFEIEVSGELAECEAERGEEGFDESLCRQSIAIYTLTEQSGRSAMVALRAYCPEIRVDLNSDHVCTDRLAALARQAGIFVFAWKSSKHQAFYCVKKHRPDGLPILQPVGKGSSSILRAVFDSIGLHSS